MEQHHDIDQHSHPYQEIRHENRVADKPDVLHQRRAGWNHTVQDQSGVECPEDGLKADEMRRERSHEDQGEYKDKLCDRIRVVAEEAPGEPWEQSPDGRHEESQQNNQPDERPYTHAAAATDVDHGGKTEQGEHHGHDGTADCYHGRPRVLKPELADNGIRHQRVGGEHRGNQQRCGPAVSKSIMGAEKPCDKG